jgi:glycerophosphoryl diester phosphodiesterase
MKVIGHRGAAGLALENSLESIRLANSLPVDGIEIDIRLTADNQFVLCHDPTLSRTSDSHLYINASSLKELKKATLNNGEKIPALEQVLSTIEGQKLVIEPKGSNWAAPLANS